ncbi:hypothetical protein L7F22_004657 [Adiantum nelumboides]|nr:hypothetical protein [Adiantum nelumboides]
MTTGPVLILPDLQKSFELYCDASGRSLGAVLMQEGRVIAYESRMFSKPEMTVQIYEKELLAVIHALTHQWRHYLLGADFTVFTDHQSLRYFLSQKQLSEKQMRWANILSQFHFQIVHVQGQNNVVADALSRKPLVHTISAIHHSTFEDMIDQYATDPDFADILLHPLRIKCRKILELNQESPSGFSFLRNLMCQNLFRNKDLLVLFRFGLLIRLPIIRHITKGFNRLT